MKPPRQGAFYLRAVRLETGGYRAPSKQGEGELPPGALIGLALLLYGQLPLAFADKAD